MKIKFTNGPCGYCPVQAEGTINGYPFYFRSRHACWALHVASSPSGDPLDDDAWSIIEDYPVTGVTKNLLLDAGYATIPECVAFIKRQAKTFTKTLI